VPDDVGDEEAGVFDEVGEFDVRGGKMFDVREGKMSDGRGSRAGVPCEDVDEVGVWGCEDATELADTSVDVGGRMHWPRRSRPRGHATLVGGEVEGDEGDWGLVVVGEGVGVEPEEGGGSLVCGGGEEDELPNSPVSRLSVLRGSDNNGVVVAVGVVVPGGSSGAVLVDGGDDEVPPESGKKMAPGQ
jgi:hypothetical protein